MTHKADTKKTASKKAGGLIKIPKPADVSALVSQCLTKQTVVTSNGKSRHALYGEACVEKMFYDAIAGDAGAAKWLVRWAEKYIPKYTVPELPGSIVLDELTDVDVTIWKDLGLLAPDEPDHIIDVSAAKINKAIKAMNKMTKNDWDAYYDKHPELLKDHGGKAEEVGV